ncbi:hypothetical protein H9P43_001989 [Blastocladiella emersonii ATCC 22665]|nr:hypothetical protein H9P43_001989 [Blastocladiella emersonii ATCC 22665]
MPTTWPARVLIYLAILGMCVVNGGLNRYYVYMIAHKRLIDGSSRPAWWWDRSLMRTFTSDLNTDLTITAAAAGLWAFLFGANGLVTLWVAFLELVKHSTRSGIWYRTLQFTLGAILILTETFVLVVLPPNFFPDANATALLWFGKDAIVVGLGFAWYFTLPYPLIAAKAASAPAPVKTVADEERGSADVPSSTSTVFVPASVVEIDPTTRTVRVPPESIMDDSSPRNSGAFSAASRKNLALLHAGTGSLSRAGSVIEAAPLIETDLGDGMSRRT